MEDNTLKIGVVGFSRNQFDQQDAAQKLKHFITQIIEGKEASSIELVSGLTNMGVPRLAYLLADELGLVTVGFSAKQALRVRAGVYPVQKQIIYGQKFGDESEEFIQYIDVLVRIGGGKQSRHETERFKQVYADKDLSQVLFEEEVEWFGK
ncbi:hypothetical protein BKI52_29810 [marine bacterium AO1-C]|nr:hypothetical protein BKI52_29810 [marine bacterium AO1-C]